MRHVILTLFVAFVFTGVYAQHVYFPVGGVGAYEHYRLFTMHRGLIKNWDPANNHFERTPLRQQAPCEDCDALYSLDSANRDQKDYLAVENNSSVNLYTRSDKPILKSFYKEKAYFLKYQKDQQHILVINPVLNFTGGKETASDKTLYQNTRGAEIWGILGGRDRGIGFYTYFTENQTLLPSPYQYFQDSLNFVPNEFFFKPFKKQGAVDYFQARGYVTFNAVKDIVKFRFGHDKNKIGNGYRSLILSDYAPQYLFFRINTDIGRVHYQNLFTQFTDNGQILGNTLFGKKYGAFHRLSFDVTHNLNIGVNEMVLFDRMDSTQSNQFDFNYLNPVIFYRSIESNLGSRDNSLMALDFNWTVADKYVFYGQFLLDEFNLNLIRSRPDWWANKYAYQLGARAFDLLGVKRLDVLAEYNRCRPYTYSHKRPTQSYSHFNQPLAHPLGANFSETILEIKYKPAYKWFVNATFIYARTGRDSSLLGRNYGSNILRSYDTRAAEFNSVMFMGKPQNLMIAEVMLSYMPKHNLFIDARINYRAFGASSNIFYSLGLRLNCSARALDY
jgi:hypothetical protein